MRPETTAINTDNSTEIFTSMEVATTQWHTGGFNPPPPQIPKALQNRAKLNPIVKTVKNCWS